MSLQNAFGDIALEATQAQISELTAQISQLTELVAYLASENANHRPRVSNNRALVVNIDSAQPAIVRLSEANQNMNINAASNPFTNVIYYRTGEPFNHNTTAANGLYTSIIVS